MEFQFFRLHWLSTVRCYWDRDYINNVYGSILETAGYHSGNVLLHFLKRPVSILKLPSPIFVVVFPPGGLVVVVPPGGRPKIGRQRPSPPGGTTTTRPPGGKSTYPRWEIHVPPGGYQETSITSLQQLFSRSPWWYSRWRMTCSFGGCS